MSLSRVHTVMKHLEKKLFRSEYTVFLVLVLNTKIFNWIGE